MLEVLVAISQKFYCRKKAWATQKLFRKKEENKRKSYKMDKCPRYLKQSVRRCPPEKMENERWTILP